jgi:hypothetical protein
VNSLAKQKPFGIRRLVKKTYLAILLLVLVLALLLLLLLLQLSLLMSLLQLLTTQLSLLSGLLMQGEIGSRKKDARNMKINRSA